MGKRSYPPLTPGEVKAILQNLGFTHARTESSHAHFKRTANDKLKGAIVTVDEGYREIGDPKLIQNMIRQSGFSREEFYGATKRTAKKASVKYCLGQELKQETE
jgi:predicted RNA binding protein YcfA (HicA-like mRNA interferase family)